MQEYIILDIPPFLIAFSIWCLVLLHMVDFQEKQNSPEIYHVRSVKTQTFIELPDLESETEYNSGSEYAFESDSESVSYSNYSSSNESN